MLFFFCAHSLDSSSSARCVYPEANWIRARSNTIAIYIFGANPPSSPRSLAGRRGRLGRGDERNARNIRSSTLPPAHQHRSFWSCRNVTFRSDETFKSPRRHLLQVLYKRKRKSKTDRGRDCHEPATTRRSPKFAVGFQVVSNELFSKRTEE